MTPQTCTVTLQCTPQETHDDKETNPMIHRKSQTHETSTKVTYTKGCPRGRWQLQ